MDSDSTLTPSFTRLNDTLRDFLSTATTDNVEGLLRRMSTELGKQPMRDFVVAVLPAVDFEQWGLNPNGGNLRTSEQRSMDWPRNEWRCRSTRPGGLQPEK